MKITDVNITIPNRCHGSFRAFANIVFDRVFVVKDAKVIDGNGGLFVVMPERKLTTFCTTCSKANVLEALWCNWCGIQLGEPRVMTDESGRRVAYASLAHPLNSAFREVIELAVIAAYQAEVDKVQKASGK